MTGFIALWLGAALASCGLTELFRRYAVRRAILDIPVARSSHTRPTPRGGGIAIALVTLIGIALAGAVGFVPSATVFGLVGGGLMVTGIGWLDDRVELTAHARLFVHGLSALWLVAWTRPLDSLALGSADLSLGLLGWPLTILFVVWVVNLYNFMDGIDGLAAGQAVIAAGVATGLFYLVARPDLMIVTALIAAAAAGFLVWNWAPARIFMGDAGSGLLGFLFAGLALISEATRALPLVGWLVLLGVFVFDATVTLLRRVLRGDRWREGHRLHAYQRAVRLLGSHGPVTVGALFLSTCLGAAVVWATIDPARLWLVFVLAGTLLSVAYLAIEAAVPMYEPNALEAETARAFGGKATAVPERVPTGTGRQSARKTSRYSGISP